MSLISINDLKAGAYDPNLAKIDSGTTNDFLTYISGMVPRWVERQGKLEAAIKAQDARCARIEAEIRKLQQRVQSSETRQSTQAGLIQRLSQIIDGDGIRADAKIEELRKVIEHTSHLSGSGVGGG